MTKSVAVLLAAAWLGVPVAAGAAARKPAAPESRWAAEPTPGELGAALSPMAGAGVSGHALAKCAVGEGGELSACQVVQELPAGSGYGKALLALVPKYRARPPGAKEPRETFLALEWYPMDVAPDWVRKPTPENLLAVFPKDAYRRGQSGQATISCVASLQGALRDCVTVSESPAGAGFGAAAVALTPQFLMRPAMKNGAPVLSLIRIPITFRTYGPQPEAALGKKVLPVNLAWAQAPSFADMTAAYPKKASAERVGGRATLACDMSEEGRLKACNVATSEPRGYGFDLAAKTLARQFSFAINSDAERKATREVMVQVPFTFDPKMLDAATPVVGKPSWSNTPSAAQTKAAFAGVKVAGTSRVTLSCRVQAGGTVGDCAVASETPAGVGLGEAAMKLVPTFRVSTWTSEGLPVVGGTISIPLRYEPETTPGAPGS